MNSPQDISSLPPYTRLLGPTATRRLLCFFCAYLLLASSGTGLVFVAEPNSAQLFGLGLVVPGGGFLGHADICTNQGMSHLAMGLASMAAFAVSLIVWFGTGNVLLPPMVWLGAAMGAAGMDHGPIQPGVVYHLYLALSLVFILVGLSMLAWFFFAHRQRSIDNAYLLQQVPLADQIFAAAPLPNKPEMTLEQLQRLRFALDRALQPVEAFSGFEHRDQFQTAALRYQVNFLGYAIAVTQARYTPALGGYMSDAQNRLILKQAEHRTWSYWQLENLWGNLRCSADPIGRENIMYTGFVALQMALFHASTASSAFSEQGAFTLRHPRGKRYTHNFESMLSQLGADYRAAPFYLVACEPNWVYPLCNTMGATAMLAHDMQRGQSQWAGHERAFRQHLETEFLDGRGRYVPCRSTHTGLALPAVGGAMPLAMPCYFLNTLAPDLARRQWLLLRRKLLNAHGQLRRTAFWPIDTGNYGFSRGSAYATTALAAIELGDASVYQACMDALESACPSVTVAGVTHRRRASVWAHGVELMARAGGKDTFRNLISKPLVVSGPKLEPHCYPDVLVAAAHPGDTMGSLQAVLYGGSGDGVQSVDVSGLQPFSTYALTGATLRQVQADADGKAQIQVSLVGRTCVSLKPVAAH